MRMRQKVSISQLPIRFGESFFCCIWFRNHSLQQENNDSTHILRNGASITPDDVLKQANINLFPEKSTTYSLYSPGQLEHIPRFSLKRDISLPYQTNPSLLFRGDYSTGGVLPSIRSWSTVRFRKPDKYGRHRAFQQCFTRLSAYFQ